MSLSNDWNSHWEQLGKGMALNPARRVRHNYLLKLLSGHHGQILDFGAGDGILASSLILQGNSVVGWEASSRGVALADFNMNLLGLKSLVVRQPSFETWPNYRFDTIIVSEVVEHIEDDLEFLLQLKSLLSPNGRVILTVPSGPISNFDIQIGHYRHYSQSTIYRLLLSAGFSSIEVRQIGFPLVNLVRLLCLISDKRMGSIVQKANHSKLIKFFSIISDRLFHRISMKESKWGWQIVAIGENHKLTSQMGD